MAEYKAGCMARSLAGRDRGCLYIIMKEDARFVFLSDGTSHPAEHPKRKNKKHVQLFRLQMSGSERTDEAISAFLRSYKEKNQK